MVIPRTTSGELLDNLALARFEKKETRMKPRSTHHRWALAIMGALMAISVAACGSSGSSAVSSAVGTHTAQAAEAKATLASILLKVKTNESGKSIVGAFNECTPFTKKGVDLDHPQPGRVEFLLQNVKELPSGQQGPYAKEAAQVGKYFVPHPISHSRAYASCVADHLPLSDAGKKAQAKACIKGKATSAFHLGMHVVQVINTMVDITLACYDQAAGLHPSPSASASASASGSATARAPASSSTATTTPTVTPSASASNGSPAAALGRTRWGTAA
jgi:hypothetical protein